MLLILNDDTKFTKFGPVETCDHTTSIKVNFQKQLRKWVKRGLLSPQVSDSIRPVGSIRPRLYGIPMIYKDGVPLRPILSMVGSAKQKLPVGFHQCFNLCWSTLIVSALNILFLFLRLSETLAQLICLCAPLTFVPFTQTFLLKKLLKFVVMSYFVVLFLNLPFQRVFSNIWLIMLSPLSSLASITSCIGRLMVWRWGQVLVPHWQIFLLGFVRPIYLIK